MTGILDTCLHPEEAKISDSEGGFICERCGVAGVESDLERDFHAMLWHFYKRGWTVKPPNEYLGER